MSEAKLEARISKLKIKLNTAAEQISRINEFIQSRAAEASIPELETRLSVLERINDNFDKYQSSLEELEEGDDTTKRRADFEELYFNLRPALLVFINKKKAGEADETLNRNSETANIKSSGLKLPKIILPQFDGDYTKWMSFIETYNALVHKNDAIDNVSRFHYLRSTLTNTALRTIQSIEISEKNYSVAYSLLVERYNNIKLISQEHIHQIFSISPISKPSSKTLRDLIDNVNVHLRALSTLGRPALLWDDVIIYIISRKLDSATLEKWEEDSPSDRMPTLKELLKSLEKRAHLLEAKSNLEFSYAAPMANTKDKPKLHKPIVQRSFKVTHTTVCPYCSGSKHNIVKCIRFLSLTPEERLTAVNSIGMCTNCLKAKHPISSCPSGQCRLCSSKHHTLLHKHQLKSPIMLDPSASSFRMGNSDIAPQVHGHSAFNTCAPQSKVQGAYILLATALIHIPDIDGKLVTCRALLDSASQLHLISENAARRLGHLREAADTPISGIGTTGINSHYKVNISIRSRCQEFSQDIEAHILPSISGQQPDRFINIQGWRIPPHVELADPNFYKPNKIDLLLGTELFSQLLDKGQIRLSNSLPTLQNTRLGWIVMGRAHTETSPPHCSLITGPSLSSLEQQINQFWEIERHDCPTTVFTTEEQLCEQHFQSTAKRTTAGQFVVRLPFRDNISQLGNSREAAIRRFLSLERRISRRPELYATYKEFMAEYQQLGHMSLIPSNKIPNPNYYLPHHCIQKLDSSTTKLRVVFDASANTSSGISLNDALMVGPSIQPDLFSILIRFRTHRYVFTGDCTKIYRQVLVDPKDCKYQLILWRDEISNPLQTYMLNTVTYGTSSASFLARRCLKQLAISESNAFPQASKTLENDFYVDDCMTGADSLNEALTLQRELVSLLKRGHFELRKFCANHSTLLNDIPKEFREKYLNICGNEVIKTLGLIWQPEEDIFQFYISPRNTSLITKRIILSDLARVFDPLGLIGPVVSWGKIFLQKLWKIKLSWDGPIPPEYANKWIEYREQISELNGLRISRYLLAPAEVISTQMPAFADSSERAYGACCYQC